MEPISEKDIPEMLDLLSAWQSLDALLTARIKELYIPHKLNERTVAILNREVR